LPTGTDHCCYVIDKPKTGSPMRLMIHMAHQSPSFYLCWRVIVLSRFQAINRFKQHPHGV